MDKEVLILFQVIGAVSFIVCWLSISFLIKRNGKKVLSTSLLIHASYLFGLGICAVNSSGYKILAVVFGLYFCLIVHTAINLTIALLKTKKPSYN